MDIATTNATFDQTANLFPALVSQIADPRMSTRYQVASTRDIVNALQPYGWEVSAVAGGRTRTKDARFAVHGVRLTHRDSALTESGEVPQLVLRNSHDGTSALTGRFGFYRFACANSVVVGATVGNFRILHRDYSLSSLLGAIGEVMAKAPEALAALRVWQKIGLAQGAELGYLQEASQLRWANGEKLPSFGQARREADAKNTLYHAFQRAQECLVKGGNTVIRSVTDATTGAVTETQRRARAIGSISENLRINTGLWDLTTQWAQRI